LGDYFHPLDRHHSNHQLWSTIQPANVYLGGLFLILLDHGPVVLPFESVFSPFHAISAAAGAAHNLQTNPCRNEQHSLNPKLQTEHTSRAFNPTFQDRSAAIRLAYPFDQQACPSQTFPPFLGNRGFPGAP
jgi:hypothetical protein